jgi:hypothetical protein
VDAGSCNGCELEIHNLNNPYYNIEGLGIHFVASPRHADMLLVTGPVAKNMEIALRRTYDATFAGCWRLRLHWRIGEKLCRQHHGKIPTHPYRHHARYPDMTAHTSQKSEPAL